DAGLSVLRQAIREPDARADIGPTRIHARGRAARIAAIEESDGSIGITNGVLPGIRLKADHAALAIVVREIRVPPDTQVEREPLAHSPVVLREETPFGSLQ